MNFLIFDTETTGLMAPSVAELEKQPRIIELAAAQVLGGEIVASRSWLINPGVPLSAEITKITGLKDSDLEGAPTFSEALPEIAATFAWADVGIAHNAPFDVGMIGTELRLLGDAPFPWPKEMLCTVQEYRHLLGERPKLTTLYEKLVGAPLIQTHRALGDVEALYAALAADGFFWTVEGTST